MRTERAAWAWIALVVAAVLPAGCQLYVNDADRDVYRLVEKRQIEAVGVAHRPQLQADLVPIKPSDGAYDFVPHPIDPEPPASFKVASATSAPADVPPPEPTDEQVLTEPGAEAQARPPVPATQPGFSQAESAQAGSAPPTSQPGHAVARFRDDPDADILTLEEALAYAFEHARDYQEAKEDLYLAALDLTLERHLWTPQFVGDVSSQYANFGEIRHFDHAMDVVSRVAVEQRLPLGGTVTAQLLSTLMRDLTNQITTGETGQALISAEIPLLKGGGLVALESRFLAERRLIYAIRTFERFRRSLAVSVAADYFDLQQTRQQIVNVNESIEGFEWLSARADAFFGVGKVTILDVQRSKQDLLKATNDLVDAVERYRFAMDTFKIRIGMPADKKIAIPIPEVAASRPAEDSDAAAASAALTDELQMPAVDQTEAVRVALKYRLDLLNELDRIGDAERGIKIAENAILPELNTFGSVRFDTDEARLGVFDFETDRTTFRGGVTLELPFDRKEERNTLRESLILKQRAQRNYELARDTVVAQVRRAMRRVVQQRQSLEIQILNRRLAQRRLRAAQLQFRKGLLASFEVVDAQTELLQAQNSLAQAQAAYKVAILEFWRDTDTLRIADDGKWEFQLARAPG